MTDRANGLDAAERIRRLQERRAASSGSRRPPATRTAPSATSPMADAPDAPTARSSAASRTRRRHPAAASRWLLAGLNVVPLTLFYGALAFALSCAVRGRQTALGAGFGVLLVSFIANGLVPLVKALDSYREVSIYYLYAASKPLTTGIRLDHVAVLLGASLALFAAGALTFQRRDMLG